MGIKKKVFEINRDQPQYCSIEYSYCSPCQIPGVSQTAKGVIVLMLIVCALFFVLGPINDRTAFSFLDIMISTRERSTTYRSHQNWLAPTTKFFNVNAHTDEVTTDSNNTHKHPFILHVKAQAITHKFKTAIVVHDEVSILHQAYAKLVCICCD